MSWKIVYRILDDADLFTDMQIYKADNGDLTAESAKKFCLESPFEIALDLDDPDIDWQDIAEHLNEEEY